MKNGWASLEDLPASHQPGILMSLHGDMLRHAGRMESHFGREVLSPH
jgi:hypothetical protein